MVVLEALLPEHHLLSAEGVDPPDLVICDIARIDPDDVADTYPSVPLLGFTNHKDTEGLRRAHAAGFDRVVVKSAPGHTPGHQVLFVKLAKTGPVLLAGDLYHYPEERTTGRVPTFEFNAEQSRASRQSSTMV